MKDRIDVRHVNVLTPTGQMLAARLQVDMVPLVLLYDLRGAERYRASGLAARPGTLARMVDDILQASEHASTRASVC